MNWYDITGEYHRRTFQFDCQLSALTEEWQRELAALWRLEADVNNGAYLQFLVNWGRESYDYAIAALNKIGASRMAEIIFQCQSLVDEHFDEEGKSQEETRRLMPNPVIDLSGEVIEEEGSCLPEAVLTRIYDLSYEFMDYPEDIAELGLKHYRAFIDGDGKA